LIRSREGGDEPIALWQGGPGCHLKPPVQPVGPNGRRGEMGGAPEGRLYGCP
jgi:hypothetical protein